MKKEFAVVTLTREKHVNECDNRRCHSSDMNSIHAITLLYSHLPGVSGIFSRHCNDFACENVVQMLTFFGTE